MAHQPLGGQPVGVVRAQCRYPAANRRSDVSSWAVQKGILVVAKLCDKDFRSILSQRGPVRFLDPSPHIGFNIFDEENGQLTTNKAPWD
ncbi:hypothetical protein F5Y12DRAFT_713694 [Xylaria sp. FL1777]|nr:hypothetical protein F5Y12DRAFT_713694 [Xylaria sp. FL1777]